MILLTKLDGMEFALNCDLIETVYENPDTTIHLTNGRLYIVKEPMDVVIERAVAYHKETFANTQG
ncbi:MAG: flagellar FlbD family protein, partial [Oscillospiraceae bacterium]